MKRRGYEALGFAVFHGGKWYLRRRYAPSRGRVASGALALSAMAALAVVVAGRR